jgi:hypothetical protein
MAPTSTADEGRDSTEWKRGLSLTEMDAGELFGPRPAMTATGSGAMGR